MNLRTAKVLITGGSSGIGLETGRLLRSVGAEVALVARDADKLRSAAAEIGALAIAGDVSQPADAARMVRTIVAEFGDFNVLVNNAGLGYVAGLLETDLERFQQVIATNLTGAMLVAQASARHFIARGGGHIVNIGSTSALRGVPRTSAYAASKFALNGMTQVWRGELRSHNIRVTLVNPSEVLTNFARVAGREQSPSERKLHPQDIAHAIQGVLEIDDRAMVTDLTVWATNPD